MVELVDGDVVVREWREDDAEPLAQQANDRAVWIRLRDAFPHPYGIADGRAFVALARAQAKLPRLFAIQSAGRVAGGIGYYVGKDVERIGAEVGYWLGREFWGRGIATRALRMVAQYAFEAEPDLQRLFAVPFADNVASARVLEKAGFVFEGTLQRSAIKDGCVQDQWMYARLRAGEE